MENPVPAQAPCRFRDEFYCLPVLCCASLPLMMSTGHCRLRKGGLSIDPLVAFRAGVDERRRMGDVVNFVCLSVCLVCLLLSYDGQSCDCVVSHSSSMSVGTGSRLRRGLFASWICVVSRSAIHLMLLLFILLKKPKCLKAGFSLSTHRSLPAQSLEMLIHPQRPALS